jgi:predicted nuclease with TOPRIM domain
MSIIGNTPTVFSLKEKQDKINSKLEELESILTSSTVGGYDELKNDIEKLKKELPEFEVKISVRQKEYLEKKLKEFEKIIKENKKNQNNFLARFSSRKFLITLGFLIALFFDNTRQIIVDNSEQLIPIILGYIGTETVIDSIKEYNKND